MYNFFELGKDGHEQSLFAVPVELFTPLSVIPVTRYAMQTSEELPLKTTLQLEAES